MASWPLRNLIKLYLNPALTHYSATAIAAVFLAIVKVVMFVQAVEYNLSLGSVTAYCKYRSKPKEGD